MRTSVFRPLQLATFAFLSLLVLGLVISALLTWRDQRRLAEAAIHLDRVYRFEQVHLLVARDVQALSDETADNDPNPETLGGELDELQRLCSSPETPAQLERLRAEVIQAAGTRQALPPGTVVLVQQIAIIERSNQAEVLGALRRDASAQLRLELAAPLAILAVGIVLLPVTRRRILQPLNAFGRQLSRLATGDFSHAPVEGIDPLILPLHQQYNALTARLAELEATHKARAESLQAEVRTATAALLEQQRSLAHAERLAATGELAASVAHELRNPLAGIHMTLANLRKDLNDAELVERVDLVLHEVERLTRLLNQLLDTARHAPEASRVVDLQQLVDEMISLLRYQVAPTVRFENRVPKGLSSRLPQDRLRQALLNLMLNSANAVAPMGGTVWVDAARAGEHIRVTVSDDGPGFPEATLQSGIRPFLSTHERGTGLGLAIVRRFARDIGGELTLANRQPCGACVTLELPSELDDRG